MDKQGEILKLGYEHFRSFAIGIFAVVIAILFGVLSNYEKIVQSKALAIWVVVILIGVITFFIYFIKTLHYYEKLIKHLNGKK